MVASNLFTAHGCWKSNRKDVCLGYWCGRSKESKVTRFNFSLDIIFYHSLLSLICYPAPLFQRIAPTAWFPGPLLFRVEVTPRSLSLVIQSKLRCFKRAESFLLSASSEIMSRRLAGLFSYNIEFFICPDQQRWFTTNVFQPLGRQASAKMAG